MELIWNGYWCYRFPRYVSAYMYEVQMKKTFYNYHRQPENFPVFISRKKSFKREFSPQFSEIFIFLIGDFVEMSQSTWTK